MSAVIRSIDSPRVNDIPMQVSRDPGHAWVELGDSDRGLSPRVPSRPPVIGGRDLRATPSDSGAVGIFEPFGDSAPQHVELPRDVDIRPVRCFVAEADVDVVHLGFT